MKQVAVFLLICICLCVYSCGEDTSEPTAVADTMPPTIVGINVQGGPIPVNTPIVLVFSERVDLTTAQRGISVLSSIDAEPVRGVITLHKGGLEAKFTPTEKMTSGGYVLTAIGIEDLAGNALMTPVSIFFGAVEVDTTQPPADVIPPQIVSSIPAEGQSAGATDSLTVRFDEEIDPASATGIVVSGVEGTVEVTGAVAIFKPKQPMQAGTHTLVIVGVRDLAGNVLASSLIVPFKVTAPPPVVVPPNIERPPKGDGTPFRVSNNGGGNQVWFEAEDYSERDPDTDEFYVVTDRDGAFGKTITRAGAGGGMIAWTFDISAVGGSKGTWYFWYRGINPSNQSDYMLVEGDPGDAEIPAGPPYPAGSETPPFTNADDRVFEEDIPNWGWARAGHDEGHTKELQNGVNTMRIYHRQGDGSVFWDVFMWTDNPSYVPTDADYQNSREVNAWQVVELAGRHADVWSRIRSAR